MTTIPFVKMHGLGNDFVIIQNLNQQLSLTATEIQQLAHRHTGIGFDQLLIIQESNHANFSCHIYNADGSEAEQCGNGMRCIARFLYEEKLTQNTSFTIETKAGVIPVRINDFDNIEVTMGIPRLEPVDIPLLVSKKQPLYEIEVGTQVLKMSALSMGNPHALFRVENVKDYPVKEIGSMVSKHALFPEGVNVGFMEISGDNIIYLRTFERGAEETLACGSNACAAAVAGILHDQLPHKVFVKLALGELSIQWDGEGHPVLMSGPASRVFSGEIRLPR